MTHPTGQSIWRRPAQKPGPPGIRLLVSCALTAGVLAAIRTAAAQSNDECMKCHATEGLALEKNGRRVSLFVDGQQYADSVHASLDCVSCHEDLYGVEQYPHPRGLDRVSCGECHEDDDGPIAAYWESTHGQLAAEGDPDAPLCQDCHGKHDILPLDRSDSAISPFNIPQMCAQCHAEGAEVARTHDIPQEQIVQRYRQSIHGTGLYKKGLITTAVCTSCHTGHHVLPHTDPRSTIYKDNVDATCMKCHGLIEQVHRKVIAGELWEKQKGVIPICVECHSPHEVRKVFYDTNMADADCLRCHRDPALVASDDGRSLFVDAEEHGRSTHGRNAVACAQCHTGASPQEVRACQTITARVDCAICHEVHVADYRRGRHGQLHAAGDPNAPYCTDCHGVHNMLEHQVADDAPDTLKSLVRESPSYSRNIPTLCGRCHREGAQAAVRYLGPESRIVEHYSMSIHGKGLLQSGLTVTATCTDCHSPHKELPASDPESTVSKENIAATCGKCHDGIYEQFELSVHSTRGNSDYLQLRGMPALPHCDDCHTSHAVARTDMPDFKLGIMEQCGKCHDDVTKTYFDTYHGKATSLGDTARAKCYDCHGAHDIYDIDDPRSHLHRDNIVATCGKCHPGSHRRFAGYLTHATHHDPDKYPALYYTFWGMTILLVGTLAFFGLHAVAWLPRSWSMRKAHRDLLVQSANGRHFVRFSAYTRRLHLMVIISFFGLAITGMTLKFSYTPWAEFLARLLGGTESAGWIHRICAIITFLYSGLHLYDVLRTVRRQHIPLREYLFGPDSILPRWSDVREFVATVRWFFGRGPRPRYGKWTYWEKFDYFAVFWGVTVIGSTGLCLWFPELFTRVLPGWSINVATIIHSDEALLATGFIFTIHFFNTHFRPEKFPMDPVIFTGSMSLEELRHERPAYYDRLLERGELEQRLTEPAPLVVSRMVRVFGLTALVIGLTLIGLILYAMLYAYK